MTTSDKAWKKYFEQGMSLGQTGDFKKAEAAFRAATRAAPQEPYPHYELGFTLFMIGKINDALEEFERTNELSCGFFLVQSETYFCEQIICGKMSAEAVQLARTIQQLTDSGGAQSEEAESMSR